jgi:membrane-bound lytic murein transglycosylase D
LLLSFLLWGCSSHKKPTTEVKDTPASETEVLPSSEDTITEETPSNPPEIEFHAAANQTVDPEIDAEVEQDPAKLLEEAMSTYQEAQRAWDQGDLDSAISCLDEAYKLILGMDLPPDSTWVQEKNDLRLLIAQRIQEIYASRATAIGENHGTIPIVENKYVLQEIKSFQGRERKAFEESYKRSGRFREMILRELRKEGLPEELAWMPIIESGFKVRAYSRARALGLWQFISSTGYRFGLKRNRWIDERMDPEKSTRAAVAYLKELHSFFGDWTTVLAAYNCGEFRVQRVIKAQRINYLDNFWDLYVMLPRETARFVPRFIATLMIINNPEKYEMNLPIPDPAFEYETITINRPIKLSSLCQNLGLPSEKLADMNPELRHKSTPDQEYNLKVPVGVGEKALGASNSLSRWIPPEATYVIHYVRRGETVSGIANRYRTSVSAIARLNRLGRRYLIRPGQRLKVPSRRGASYSASSSLSLTKEGDKLVYKVKRGDSLYLIANAFNMTIQKIKAQNNLRSNMLRIGQKLIIHAGTPEGSIMYTVKSGDTPYKIAQRYGMSLSVLLKMNGLTTRSKIYPGQKLWITSK